MEFSENKPKILGFITHSPQYSLIAEQPYKEEV